MQPRVRRLVFGGVAAVCLAAAPGVSVLARDGAEWGLALQPTPRSEEIARIVRPRADETRWNRIPWLTDLAQAQRVAQQEHRPLFIFISGDDPLEAC